MIKAEFIEKYEFNINEVIVIDINKKTVLGNPDYDVLVSENEKPKYLLHIYLFEEADCFHELKYSNNHVVIGCGENVYFFNTEQEEIKSYTLSGYFGHLYPIHDVEADFFEEHILVSSANDLLLFNINGDLNWISTTLGIDGVVVNDVIEGLIIGEGEYDPPGGWIDFKLDIKNGKNI